MSAPSGRPVLTPTAIEPCDFYGDRIALVRGEGDARYVVPKRICDLLSVDWSRQSRKLATFAAEGMVIMSIPSEDGGNVQGTVCLSIRYLPRWLLSIHAGKVREEYREKLVRLQDELTDALYRYCFEGGAVNPRGAPAPAPPLGISFEQLQSMIVGIVRATVREAFAEAPAPGGTIGAARANREILAEIRSIALLHGPRGSKAWRQAHRRIQNKVRDRLDLGVSRAWRDQPARRADDIISELVDLRKDEEEAARRRAQTGFGFNDERPN